MMREYTEDEVEAAMDKPHHPLVIRPWKTQQIKQKKWNTSTLKAGEARFDPKGSKFLSATKAGRKQSKNTA
jgi:hypothetical protein